MSFYRGVAVRAYPSPSTESGRGLGELGVFDRDSWQEMVAGARAFHAACARLMQRHPYLTINEAKAEIWRKLGF